MVVLQRVVAETPRRARGAVVAENDLGGRLGHADTRPAIGGRPCACSRVRGSPLTPPVSCREVRGSPLTLPISCREVRGPPVRRPSLYPPTEKRVSTTRFSTSTCAPRVSLAILRAPTAARPPAPRGPRSRAD